MSDRLMRQGGILAAGFCGAAAVAVIAFAVLRPPGAAAPGTDRQVQLVELIGAKFPVDKTIEALVAPEIGAPSVTRVRQGSEVNVVGIVQGDDWYQIELPGHQIAYVQVTAIPAAAAPPAATPQPMPMPAPVAAAAQVSPPPSLVVPAAQPTLAPSAPPEVAPGTPPTVDVPPVVEFEEAHDVLSVYRPSAVYLKPSGSAPQAYPVGVGTRVYVIARSKDGNWAWVNTADSAPAYMPLADLAQ